MNFFFSFIFLVSSVIAGDSNSNTSKMPELKPCPDSPNCVCTQEERKRKRMDPISFTGSVDDAIKTLEKVLIEYPNAKLVEREGNYFHYTFKTKIGGFIDDVEFVVDGEAKEIHFRSASRTGYSDLGKNRRRMKKIRKEWEAISGS